jgi:hypothetical protein
VRRADSKDLRRPKRLEPHLRVACRQYRRNPSLADGRYGTSVNDIIDTADVGRPIGREEGYQFRDLFRSTRASDGNAAQHVYDALTRSLQSADIG